MLNATVQKLGDSTVLRCQGRIVIGDAYRILRNTVLRQTHTRTLVLDLAQVDRIDAGGLGVLLGLREWAYSHAIRFRLMNVMNQVELVLELTKLDRIFEFCSVEDMFDLLHATGAAAQWSEDQANERILKSNCDDSVEGQDAPPNCPEERPPSCIYSLVDRSCEALELRANLQRILGEMTASCCAESNSRMALEIQGYFLKAVE
jgi:anti-sigma B factor antagonist